jgi:putative restriction endonuclease
MSTGSGERPGLGPTVTSLHQWRRGGERAPHKPLRLLCALGRLQRNGTSAVNFAEAETDIRSLLQEYGPPRNTSPGYPFHHLTTDGLWIVRTPSRIGSPGPNLGELRAPAVGELFVDFAQDVERGLRLFAAVVPAILDANLPRRSAKTFSAQWASPWNRQS